MLRAEFLLTGFVELLLNAHEVVLEARALVLQEPVLILDLASELLLTLTLFRNDLELLLHGVPLQAPVLELGLGLFELRLLPLNLSHRVVDLGLCFGNGALPFLLPYGHPLVLEIFLAALKLRFELLQPAHALFEVDRRASIGILHRGGQALLCDGGLRAGGIRFALKLVSGDDLCDLSLVLDGGLAEGFLLGDYVLHALPHALDDDDGLIPLLLRIRAGRFDLGVQSCFAVLDEAFLLEAREGSPEARGHVDVTRSAGHRHGDVPRGGHGSAENALPAHVSVHAVPAYHVHPRFDVVQ